MTDGGYTKEQAAALQTFSNDPAAPLRTGEAHVGDWLTPAVPITLLGGAPAFEPGDPVILREVTGAGGCLVRVECASDPAKTGLWATVCFTRLGGGATP